jgi:hypothetical protein
MSSKEEKLKVGLPRMVQGAEMQGVAEDCAIVGAAGADVADAKVEDGGEDGLADQVMNEGIAKAALAHKDEDAESTEAKVGFDEDTESDDEFDEVWAVENAMPVVPPERCKEMSPDEISNWKNNFKSVTTLADYILWHMVPKVDDKLVKSGGCMEAYCQTLALIAQR